MNALKGNVTLNSLGVAIGLLAGIVGIVLGISFKNTAAVILSCLILSVAFLVFGFQWVFRKRFHEKMAGEAPRPFEPHPRGGILIFGLCVIIFAGMCFYLYQWLEGSQVDTFLLEFLNLAPSATQ